MTYEIFGQPMPAVTVRLNRDEGIYTQSGGMAWMSEQIRMETNAKGGLLKGLGRMLSGDSLFLATYTAEAENQQITFASTFPGEIIPFSIGPGYEIIAQKGAFLCAEEGVSIDISFKSGGVKAGFFGGEGFVLQRFTGNGTVFCELDGTVRQLTLAPGETVKVDTGNVAAFESQVRYSVETVKGFKNVLFGGEGLFLTTLTGPGNVWLQTMAVSEMAHRFIPFLPKQSSGS